MINKRSISAFLNKLPVVDSYEASYMGRIVRRYENTPVSEEGYFVVEGNVFESTQDDENPIWVTRDGWDFYVVYNPTHQHHYGYRTKAVKEES